MSRRDFNKNAYATFAEITIRHGCSPVDLLHTFRTPFPKNTTRRLLLYFYSFSLEKQKLSLWRFLALCIFIK